jgi:hypothetical protein
MPHIKEPQGINFVVNPTPLTALEREKIAEIIAFYKKTGKKKTMDTVKVKTTKPTLRKTKELV